MATKTEIKKYFEKLKKNPNDIWGIPFEKLSTDECLTMVQISGRCLCQMSNRKKTKKVCEAAVEKYPMALEYVPDKLKTLEMCQSAYQRNAEVFPYLLPEMYTLDLSIECYERLLKKSYIEGSLTTISTAMPKEYHQNEKIFSLERKLGIRKVVSKKYKEGKFVVIEDICYEKEDVKSEFESFMDFYIFVDKDLKGAELFEFDFAGVNIEKLDISEAYVSAKVLKSNNMYSDEFFHTHLNYEEELTVLIPYEQEAAVDVFDIAESGLSEDIRKIYYISDLHLNHKIRMKFPECATENEVGFYIKEIVANIIKTRTEYSPEDFLIIAGDVSFDFKIAEMFYTELAKKWSSDHIVVILGNHELWNYGGHAECSLENIIEDYRKLFKKLQINFLQNDLLLITGDYSFCEKITIIKEKEILSHSAKWLREKCRNSRLNIFGGIGFSGENKEFNAEHGIYRKTIESLESDKQYTKEFKTIYDKVKSVLGNNKVVVLTHMPYSDWSKDELIPNWIYVCGHTHRNCFCMNDQKTLYADNQIGYYTTSMGLKHFQITIHYDIFADYHDGIYEISREEYLDFNRGIKVKLFFNRTEGQIVMLKREGIYCFLYKSDNKRIYVLKGGLLRKVKHQDIQYFYDTMLVYKKALEYIMHDYHEALRFISRQIKRIGGSGRIHGSIVDIDYYNHVYLNPISGQILPYNALAIDYRYEYPNLETLLINEREDLYLTYQEIDSKDRNELQIFKDKKIVYDLEAVKIVSDTSMYTPSNIFRSLQYMFDVNVIREWDEELVERVIEKYLGGVGGIEDKAKEENEPCN